MQTLPPPVEIATPCWVLNASAIPVRISGRMTPDMLSAATGSPGGGSRPGQRRARRSVTIELWEATIEALTASRTTHPSPYILTTGTGTPLWESKHHADGHVSAPAHAIITPAVGAVGIPPSAQQGFQEHRGDGVGESPPARYVRQQFLARFARRASAHEALRQPPNAALFSPRRFAWLGKRFLADR